MELEAPRIIAALNRWYGTHARDLPWRHNVTPYRVWLSEIMLQQTTVPAVIPYFEKFTAKYPDIHALARAPVDDVMHDWAGLGYYSRARNLHACAQAVSRAGGVFPSDTKGLAALPGIGPYTAGAIAALAFHTRASVVDGNVERVLARLFALTTPLPALKKDIRALADTIYLDPANTDPSALPQAFMDLGASVCTPQNPLCGACPLAKMCIGFAQGIAATLPLRERGKDKPKRMGRVYWVENDAGEILAIRRPAKGLLGGMAGLPTTAWEAQLPAHLNGFHVSAEERTKVKHVFTHFDLTLSIARARVDALPDGGYWVAPAKAGFPTVFAKVVRLLQTA